MLPAAAQLDSVSEDAVRLATLEALAGRLPGAVDRIRVMVHRIPTHEGSGEVAVSLPDHPVVPRGRLQVPVSVDNERVGSAMVEVAHFDSVATLIESVSTGDSVLPASFRYVWMDVTRFSGDPLTPARLAAMADTDLIAHRSLRADRPLRATDIGPRPAAETGDPVRMTYRRGAFVLEMACRARDRGQIGDIIRIYADDSDTMYRARLTAPGRAEWVETL